MKAMRNAERLGGSAGACRTALLALSLSASWGMADDTLSLPESRARLPRHTVDDVRPPTRFDTTMLQRTAGTGSDVNRVLATDVSAQSSGLLSDNALMVRGGRIDENLYVLNGFEFPNMDHFSLGAEGALGFVSVSTLKELKLYAGTTPSEFASSAASAVLVETRSGNADRFGSSLDLSITGCDAVVEGPLGPGSGAFISQFRYLDFRPLRDWITTGQMPRFMDGTLGLDLNHGSDSYGRIYGLYTWDRMSTRLREYGDTRYERSGRAGLSYLHFLRVGDMRVESGVSGLLSSKSSQWISDRPPAGGNTATSFSDAERTGRAFLQASFGDPAASSLQTGIDVKISNPELDRISIDAESDTSLVNIRSGGFVEYSGTKGPYGIGLGLRAEYFSIYSALGLSPQASFYREIGGNFRLTLDGSLRYVPHGELADVAIFSLFDNAHPPYDLNTLGLKRVWLMDAKLAAQSRGVEYELTGYAKLYDREFKLIDGLHRSYYGRDEPRGDGVVSTFTDPTGKRLVKGLEAKATGSIWNRFRFCLGIGFISIEDEYLDGNFYRDKADYGFSAKGIGYLSMTRHQLLSLSMIGSQGRPIWRNSQIADRRYYDERLPDLANACARYTFDRNVKRVRVTVYAEVDNLLNRTSPVYQDIDENGRSRYLSMNGVFPLIGIQVSI
jgi:hypothetical protein